MSDMSIDASATRTFVGENPERTSVPMVFAPEHLKCVRKFRTIKIIFIMSENKFFFKFLLLVKKCLQTYFVKF